MNRSLGRFARILFAGTLSLSSLALAGCGPSEEEEVFEFDGDDMRSEIEGTWKGTITADDGSTKQMELTLAYVAPDKSAACGSRVLGSGAPGPQPLCDTQSSVSLAGSLTIADGDLTGAEVKGSFSVSGSKLTNGYLEAQISQLEPPPDDTVRELAASGSLEGNKLSGQLSGELVTDDGTFELTRD